MQALQEAIAAAFARIATLETEVSSQRKRAEAAESQVTVMRAALYQAREVLTATSAAEQQQRTQIEALTNALEQQMASQAVLSEAVRTSLTSPAGSAVPTTTLPVDSPSIRLERPLYGLSTAPMLFQESARATHQKEPQSPGEPSRRAAAEDADSPFQIVEETAEGHASEGKA